MIIWKNKVQRVVFILSLLILAGALASFLLKFSGSQNQIIIHFDSYHGINFVGGAKEVFVILGITLLLILINGFMAEHLFHRERILSYFFAFGSLMLSAVIFAAIRVIISVN